MSATSREGTNRRPHDGLTDQLRRLRWAVRATLTLGVAASVAANVLHARPNPISQIIAAWPPLALLLTVELISRVPHQRRFLGAIRIAATAVIAAIATWVSYWHLAGVAARYGETEHGAAYLLPTSVDGLVIVASVSLVEITARIRAAALPPATPTFATTPSASTPQPADPAATAVATAAALSPTTATPTTATNGTPTSTDPAAAAATTADGIETVPPATGTGQHPQTGPTAMPSTLALARGPTTTPEAVGGATTRLHQHHRPHENPLDHSDPQNGPDPSMRSEPTPRSPSTNDGSPNGPTPQAPGDIDSAQPTENATDTPADNVPADTAAAVAYWRHHDPDLHPADIAARIGKSERTVRRHWSPAAATPHVNGHPADNLRRRAE